MFQRRGLLPVLAIIVVMLAPFVGVARWKLPHILWQYRALKLGRVPVATLVVAPPEGSVVDGGCLAFTVPEKWQGATTVKRVEFRRDVGGFQVKTPDGEVVVLPPYPLHSPQVRLLKAIANNPQASPLQCKAELYESSSDDFSWWMTHKELQTFQRRVGAAFLLRTPETTRVELFANERREVLLKWQTSRWQAEIFDYEHGMCVEVTAGNDSPTDPDTVRAWLMSIRLKPGGTDCREPEMIARDME